MRVAILDAYDNLLGFMDNDVPEALHFWDDELHSYLKGSAFVFSFTADGHNADCQYLQAGNKLSFKYGGRDYYSNILTVKQNENTVTVEAESLTFELLNEQAGPLKSDPKYFAQYISDMGAEIKVLEIGINEVMDKKAGCDITESETLLARLFSLADLFDAEIEFLTILDDFYGLDRIQMNIYDRSKHGVGQDRTGEILRYGVDYEGLSKSVDLTDVLTAIRGFGQTTKSKRTTTVTTTTTTDKDTGEVLKTVTQTTVSSDEQTDVRTVTRQGGRVETTIKSTVKDGDTSTTSTKSFDNGVTAPSITSKNTTVTKKVDSKKTEEKETTLDLTGFYAIKKWNGYDFVCNGEQIVRCPEARDTYPSTVRAGSGDRYIVGYKTYSDAKDQGALFDAICEDMKTSVVPKVSYELSGYIPANVGDTFTIEDASFEPVFYAEARVIEQKICTTDPEKSSTTFDNFTVVKPVVNKNAMAQVKALIDETVNQRAQIISDNGVIFKNHTGQTTLTADVADGLTVHWTKDGKEIATGKSIVVKADDVDGRALYGINAYNSKGVLKAQCVIAVVNVSEPVRMEIVSSNGTSFKSSIVETVLSVNVYNGDETITTSDKLKERFGNDAGIVWLEDGKSVDAGDARLKDGGFSFSISAKDFKGKSVFTAELVF